MTLVCFQATSKLRINLKEAKNVSIGDAKESRIASFPIKYLQLPLEEKSKQLRVGIQ